VNDNVKRLAVANGPNIFQMLLVRLCDERLVYCDPWNVAKVDYGEGRKERTEARRRETASWITDGVKAEL